MATRPQPAGRDWAALAAGSEARRRESPPGAPFPAARKCIVCDAEHEPCQFTAGSLYCIRPACPNPHHQPRTAAP